jgi:hypothetical protein
MSADQERLSELTGELNIIMQLHTTLTVEKSRILREIDYFEKLVQQQNQTGNQS